MKKKRIWITVAVLCAIAVPIGAFALARLGRQPDAPDTQPSATGGATEPTIAPTEPSNAPTEPSEPPAPTDPTVAPTAPTDPTVAPSDPAETTPDDHTHSYTAVVTEPSCTEGGYTTYTCTCGDRYIADETAPTAHRYDAVTTEATCTEGAKTVYTCTACGDSYTESSGKANGHSWNAWATTKEPTCTSGGTESRTCKACGKAESRSTEAYGHEIESGDRTEPTCEADGSITGVCNLCGKTVTRTLPSPGHAWSDWTTDGDTQTRTCNTCGKAEKLEHEHEWEYHYIEETCTDGYESCSICNICGAKYVYGHGAPRGHQLSDPVVTKEATVTEPGEEQRTCTVCGEVLTFVTRPLDPETGKAPENYIDPKMEYEADINCWRYLKIRVLDRRDWGNGVSIVVNADDSVTVVFYLQDGEKITENKQQPTGDVMRRLTIQKDGSYKWTEVGKFS